MVPIRLGSVDRETIRPHPTMDDAVLVTAPLDPRPENLWQARFSQSLLRSSEFGRFELGNDAAAVNITVHRDEQVVDRLAELATIVEQTNGEVAEEAQRLDAAEAIRQRQRDADVERVRRDVDALNAGVGQA